VKIHIDSKDNQMNILFALPVKCLCLMNALNAGTAPVRI
jgi:hypothetical protein